MSIRHDRDLRYKKTRNKNTVRPKTFKSEETAKAYAEANGIKKYSLVNLRAAEAQVKKLRIVEE